MPDRLPPLTALRAFEAAARHLSFAKAADELNVTPAALSFQIKALETHLGLPLFHRLNRAVTLTEAGAALSPGTTDGFDRLTRAWQSVRRRHAARGLTITAGPAFTAKWLAPRLFAFAQAHPEIELRFVATLRLLDLARDDVDVAIRFGPTSREKGVFARPIIREWLTPMMAPGLAEGLTGPADLARMTLLHQDDLSLFRPALDWPAWFRAAGLPDPPDAGPRFSQADHAIDAAEAGAGVVLGRASLAEPSLREGRLVAPFALALTTEAHYRFLCAEGRQASGPVREFLDWIEAQVAPFADPTAGIGAGKTFVAAKDVAAHQG